MFLKFPTIHRQDRETFTEDRAPAGPAPVAIVRTATTVLAAVRADELSRILADLAASATPATVETFIAGTLVSARSTTHPGSPTNVFTNLARFAAEHPDLAAA